MKVEILEAITDYFKDDEDTMADCLIYLSEITPSNFSYSCIDELVKRNRCTHCGMKLVEYCYKEYHSEVNAYEDICELICPGCDY